MKPDSSICIICKGSRGLCGLEKCPLLQKYYIENSICKKIEKVFNKSSIFGPSPPNIFVSSTGYPDVRAGPLVNVSDIESTTPMSDNPSEWYGLPLERIVEFRSLLFRPMQITNVKRMGRQVEEIQDAILSTRPIDVEATITGKPYMKVSFSSHVQPMGPSAKLKKAKVVENPKIPKIVDSVINEKMKAVESSQLLFDRGFDIYYLTKVLSAGILGIKKRMVPTRWSIVAIDSMLSKYLIKKIKTYPWVSSYEVYSSGYLSNHYEILLIPGNWEFENFEAWAPGTLWSQGLSKPEIIEEWEGYDGRTTYAVQGGGYYSNLYAVTESLNKMRKQARVVVFREIYPGYMIPVGVWQTRENIRNAFKKKAKKFNTLNGALEDMSSRLKNPLKEYLKQSKILGQTRLVDF